MRATKQPEDVTLVDVLVDGFEKNEIFDGFHWRSLPMPDETSAIRKLAQLADHERGECRRIPTRGVFARCARELMVGAMAAPDPARDPQVRRRPSP